MADTGQIIRLFISSTFADFFIERDILQRDVFPAIRNLCLAEGFRFQPIDLRWGVSEDAGNDGRILSICFEEIRRCQRMSPDLNFLILLGDRYGSRLLPDTIPSFEYEKFDQYLSGTERDLLRHLYGEDHNFIELDKEGHAIKVPQYVPLPDARKDAKKEEIQQLVEALIRVTKQVEFTPDRALAYAGSATHQEIQRGLLDSHCDPASVLCAFRSLEGSPQPPDTSVYAEPERDQDGRKRLDGRDQLANLRHNIEARLGELQILRYSARWVSDEQGLTLDRAELRQRLYALIEQRVCEVMRQRKQTPQAQNPVEAANKQFEQERTDQFVGRTE